ncbi:MAG: MBOAT family protein [Gemmatimonadetes bacterium]|nr:MBOAT family protein [Gemmatimonadota bacterium]
MLFTEPRFALFVAVALAAYYARPLRAWQPATLVVASLAFYATGQGAPLVALLLASALLNGGASWLVARSATAPARRAWAVAGVALNLGVLAVFKYRALLSLPLLPATLPLPVGISFYTFHGISLVVDVWRRDYRPPDRPARHARDTLLYLVFFPQLIAGPIARARKFLPQVTPKRSRDIRWRTAARALIAGYFLKLCVADHLHPLTALLDAPLFTALPAMNVLALLAGYSAQIFADFAGYSLIAVGLAALFGYVLPQNFDRPYAATSMRDFWRRWHRSLSQWLRDYLYRPLGGSRRGRARTAFNILVVMALGGLWHGAAWGFALWGLWHGIALVVERALVGDAPPTPGRGIAGALRATAVFAVVTAGWTLFRFTTLDRLRLFALALRDGATETPIVLPLLVLALYALPVIALHAMPRLGARTAARWARWAPAIDGLMLALIILDAAPPAPFIYFQF